MEYITVKLYIVPDRSTELAWCVSRQTEMFNAPIFYVPRSICKSVRKYPAKAGHYQEGHFELPDWFLRKKDELSDYES